MFEELFGNSPIFGDLDSSELEKVIRVCDIVELKRGEYVFREGDAGDRLFLIAEGAVRISRMIPGSGEEALVVLHTGACFGEMAIFDRMGRSTDAIVDSRSLLLSITRDAFQELLESDKDLAHKVLWSACRMLSERLRGSNEQLRSVMVMAMF
ncbi:MAG: Crp/Fnr family transcriptional regulator [Longimicrobiales bacterium]